jgi:hypothetical protein
VIRRIVSLSYDVLGWVFLAGLAFIWIGQQAGVL